MKSGSISWSVWRASSSMTRSARGLRPGGIRPANPAAAARAPTRTEPSIARPEPALSDKAIARGLAEARLDVYRVRSVTPGVYLELESLSDDTSVRVAWRDGLEHFRIAEILVARVVGATAAPTLWGPGARFPADGERRWRARLA